MYFFIFGISLTVVAVKIRILYPEDNNHGHCSKVHFWILKYLTKILKKRTVVLILCATATNLIYYFNTVEDVVFVFHHMSPSLLLN